MINSKVLNQTNKRFGAKDDEVGWNLSLEKVEEVKSLYERGHYDDAISESVDWIKNRIKSINDLPKMNEGDLALFYYTGKSYLESGNVNATSAATGCFHMVYSQQHFSKRLLGSFRQFLELSKVELENIARAEGEDYVNNYNVEQFANNTLSKKCFIATAACGSPLAPEVIILSRFRDEVLLDSMFGKAFVEFYYFVSPPLASLITKTEFLRAATRSILIAPILRLLKATKFSS